jgi:hypothetical protein
MLEFPHKPPKDYSYEYEQFNASTIRIMLHCNRQFDYNLGASTKTIWGFYKPKKRIYLAPVNAKTIGKQVDINSTTPYSAMQLKQTPLEQFFV